MPQQVYCMTKIWPSWAHAWVECATMFGPDGRCYYGHRRPTTDEETQVASDVPVLYLDLDGTVRHGRNELGRFVNSPDDVVIFPEALDLMHRWKEEGGRIVGVSNQGGIALGHITNDQCQATMAATHQACHDLFDTMVWCPHHPNADTPRASRCWCRKPSIGMIIEGAARMHQRHPSEQYPPHLGLLVGDRPEDQQAADAASLTFIRAHAWRATATETGT